MVEIEKKRRNNNNFPGAWVHLLLGLILVANIVLELNKGRDTPSTILATTTPQPQAATPAIVTTTTTTPVVQQQPQTITRALNSGAKQQSFYDVAMSTGTDKVGGPHNLAECLKDDSKCPHGPPGTVNEKCRAGHFYHTMYDKWLGPYSTQAAKPFQFLEIGFFNGRGFDAYKKYLPNGETHSIEIACLPEGPREEGKWPWGNFPKENPRYQEYLDSRQLHCGDGSDYDFLQQVWTTEMKRPGAPPLKVVVDDAAHISAHMAMTLFFWFPKIEPGGILVVEDIQPIPEANDFRLHVLPQVIKDMHYCGDPRTNDKACFPTIQPLLQSVTCEMHICVFERNNKPAVEYDRAQSVPPPNALHAQECLFGTPFRQH